MQGTPKWVHRFVVNVYPSGVTSLTLMSRDGLSLEATTRRLFASPPPLDEGVYYSSSDAPEWSDRKPLYQPTAQGRPARHRARAWLLSELRSRGETLREDLERGYHVMRGGRFETSSRGMARHLASLRALGLVKSEIGMDGRARYSLVDGAHHQASPGK